MYAGDRECAICGDIFLFTRHQLTKKYCSDKCHRKANNKKSKPTEKVIKHGEQHS